MTNRPTGTKEWAKKTENLFHGRCGNNCIYCYAGANLLRFKQSPVWKRNEDKLRQKFSKRNYVTMYPSSHDIRPEDIMDHVEFLHHLLAPGNEVLIVTKPWIKTIDLLTYALRKYKNQVTFRFTVGSIDDDVLHLFEPDAPTFSERKYAIIKAYLDNYKTSLSIEPMLDVRPQDVVYSLQKYITGDIWIGKLRHAKRRCMANGCSDKLWKETIEPFVAWQEDDENILDIVNAFADNKQIKWKDSIIQVLDRSFHILYSINGSNYNIWKQFDSFQLCESWVKEQKPTSYEIGIPYNKLPINEVI